MSKYCQRFFVYLRSLALGLAVAGAAGPLHAEAPAQKTGAPPTKIEVPAAKIAVPPALPGIPPGAVPAPPPAKITVPTAPVAAVAPFTADTAAPAKRQGMVSTGGLNWQCQGARCMASGAQTLFGIESCRALAREAGLIRSFASAKQVLSAAELSQCNLGIGAGAAAGIGTLTPPPLPGLPPVPNPAPSGGGAAAETAPTGSKLPLAHRGGGFAPAAPQAMQAPATPQIATPALSKLPVEPTPDQSLWDPIRKSTTPIAIPAAKPEVTPPASTGFTPKTIATGPLELTGQRFTPKTITTSPLELTGQRFTPKTIATSPLELTGQRFTPKTIATGPLELTGQRSDR